MITTNFYIPTQSINIPAYFAIGLILPFGNSNGTKNNQKNIAGPFIIISTKKWVEDSNCSVEVILTTGEQNKLLQIDDDFFAFGLPLPITRIKQIYFKDKVRMENTLWNTNISTAYIPQRLASVDEEFNASVSIPDYIKESQAIPSQLQHLINRFDVLLGGFALMKIATTPELNFSKNYFATLSYFNQIIEADVKDAESKYNLTFDRKYHGLFTSKQNEWSKWTKYIYGSVNVDDVETLAKRENTAVKTKLGILQIDSIDPNSKLFDVALLAAYGPNKSKSFEDLLSFLQKSNLSDEKVEEIAFLFGLHLGYTQFKNNCTFRSNVIPIKFQLESRLDYYIIESMYNYLFNGGKVIADFPYIESIVPVHNETVIGPYFYILDHPVLFKKKDPGGEDFFYDFETQLYKKLSETYQSLSIPGFKFDQEAFRIYYNETVGAHIKVFKEKILKYNNDLGEKKIPVLPTPILSDNSPTPLIELQTPATEDGLEELTLSELKDVAKGKGITKLPKYKATKKDLEAFIALIRSTQNIL